jgi:hypothetical protein
MQRVISKGRTEMNDEKGATEDEVEKIDVIRGTEALGYEGSGREEHSGENAPREPKDLSDELADNRPEDGVRASRPQRSGLSPDRG